MTLVNWPIYIIVVIQIIVFSLLIAARTAATTT